jgi:hypothetical protein
VISLGLKVVYTIFVCALVLLFPLAVYLPTHLLFARIFRAAAA